MMAVLSLAPGLCAQSPAPTISSVICPPNGSYRAAQNINFTVNFSAEVTVTGTPQLPLIIGSSQVSATYSSGSPGTALVFTYIVQAGETDTNGIVAVSPMLLSGGTIQNGGTDAALNFTVPDTTMVLVDTTPPTVVIGPPSVRSTTAGPVSYTVTYADIGFRFSSLDVADIILNRTGTAAGNVAVTGSGLTRTVTISDITGNGTLGISIAANTAYDLAGNSAPAPAPSATFAVAKAVPNAAPSFDLNGGAFSDYNTNRVRAWGKDASGERDFPPGLSATALAAGYLHGLAAKSDGTVVAWGVNSFGETTIPVGLINVTSVAAGRYFSVALKHDGTVVAWGVQTNTPAGLADGVAIVAGLNHALALRSGGTVVGWGDNTYGQAEAPAGLADVVAIAAGGFHNLALKSDGTVVGWGINQTGAATAPDGLSNVVAIAAGFFHSLALKNDGTVVAWGTDNAGQSSVPAGLSKVVAITAGLAHSVALKSDGTVVAWGEKGSGQLNIPVGLTGVMAVQSSSSSSYTLARYTDAVLTVMEDSGAFSTNQFVTNLLAGPVGESTQSVSLVATNDNPGLFSVQPVIDASGTLTFTAAADASGAATVSVFARDNGGTAGGGVDTSAARNFTIAITPVNDPPTSYLPTNRVVVLEDCGDYRDPSFAVLSPGPPNEGAQLLTIKMSNDNPGLFRTAPVVSPGGLLTFTPAANSNGIAIVTIIVEDDGGTANGGVDRITNTFTITILPVNDPPSIALTTNDIVVLEDSGAYRAALATFSPGPPDEAGQNIGVTVSNDNPSLFSTVPVLSLEGVLTFTPATNANGVTTVTIIAQDDGGTANGGVDRTTNTFTITVTAVNDAPTLGPIANPAAILEDAGPQTIRLGGISAGGSENQTLTITATSSNPGLIPNPTVNYLTPGATGSLVYTPVANANGTAVITVVVQDDGGRANGGVDAVTNQFAVTVVAVNDPPTAVLATNNVVVLEDSGPYTNLAFAVFSVGPADEVGALQKLTNVSILSVTNAELFSSGPVLTRDGALTFTPATNANGTALVTFSVQDNGGTSNGGMDSSTNTFLITVTSVNDGPRVSFAQDQVGAGADSGAQALAGFAAFSAGPSNESSQNLVSYTLTTDNAALFSVGPAISLAGLLTFTPAAGVHGAAWVMVVVQDDGGTENGGVDRGTNAFLIKVAQADNTAPTVVQPIRDFSVNEDGGNVVSNLVSVFADVQTPSVSLYYRVVENTNAALVTATIYGRTNLMLVLASNGIGASRIVVSAMDDGGLMATNAFVVTVNAVNDPPTFSVLGNVLVDENSGAYSRTRFAGPVSPGPPDEAGHTVNFHVTNDNAPLFSVPPAISTVVPRTPDGVNVRPLNEGGGGTLTFTPTANAYGVAHVTVYAQDNGGTANGGIDTSAPQQFIITVFAPPTNTVPGTQTNSSNKPLYFTATNAVDNLIYVSDPDSTNLTVTLTVTNGTVTVPTTNGLEVTGNSTTNLALYGSIANLNAALQTLTYLSFTNAFGGDLLTVVTVDDTPIGGQTNVVPTTVPIYIEVPTLGGVPKVSLDALNTPTRTVTNVMAVTNGPNALDTNFVQGISFNSASNVVNVLPVGGQDGSTNRTTITVTVQYSDGTTELITVPVIIYQPLLTSVTGDSTYNSTFGTPIFNPQTSLYEQKVSVVNHTPFDFAALRIAATNLPAGVILRNASITNGGLPYIEYNLPVPSGSTQTLTLEYYSTRRGTPVTPGLKLELLNSSRVIPPVRNPVAQAVLARRGYAPDGRVKFYIEFPTVAGSIYYVQYKDAVGDPWKTSPVNIIGTGNRLNWMDEGAPNTDSAPGLGRFYQIVTGN